MKQPWHGNNKNYREQIDDMVLHFINGFMIMDVRTAVSSPVLFYKATIYSDEHIGEITDSDIMIGYNENQQVWVTVRNSDGSSFEWDNRERDRKVTVLFYVLMYDREYLLYCSNIDFFCYLTIPKEDPRENHTGRIPNMHLDTTYKVLDELLIKTNRNYLKCRPGRVEG